MRRNARPCPSHFGRSHCEPCNLFIPQAWVVTAGRDRGARVGGGPLHHHDGNAHREVDAQTKGAAQACWFATWLKMRGELLDLQPTRPVALHLQMHSCGCT